MESNFIKLPRKRLEEEIESCRVAIEKHQEGQFIHEIVKKGFEEELSKLPEEEECTSTSESGD